MLTRALEVAGLQPGERFEVAAKPARGGMQSLWTTEPERAERWLRARRSADLYLLGNPIAADAPRRRGGRAREVDCSHGRVLLLDVDPEKDKATDPQGTDPAKINAAKEIADELVSFLRKRCGVQVPLISSGRGRQLWAKIDGELEGSVRRRLVVGLAKRFDRAGLATLDPKTYNVARLMRLPGGVNSRTGNRAAILDPGDGQAIPADVLHQLANELAPPKPKVEARGKLPASGGRGGEQTAWTKAILDAAPVARALELLGITAPEPGGRIPCPIHGGQNRNFSIERAGWRCWSKCDTSGSSIDLVAAVRGLEYLEARDWLAERVGVRRPKPEARKLPLLDVRRPGHDALPREKVQQRVRGVLRWKGKRGDDAPVLQDVSPTGTGKTTRAARELVDAAAEGGQSYSWASPSHDHARDEVLPALAEAGAAVWDMDLDGGENGGVRGKLQRLGAAILPLGTRPKGARPVACKLEPFYCPGPAVPGWTSEEVERLYQAVAADGWNPAAAVCRACPKFLKRGDSGMTQPCTYWEGRREAAGADLLVIAHHSMRAGGTSTSGRAGLVIDEDPKGALVRIMECDAAACRAFAIMVDAAADLVAEDAGRKRGLLELVICEIEQLGISVDRTLRRNELEEELEELDQLAGVVFDQAEQVNATLAAVEGLWSKLHPMFVAPPVAELEQPDAVDPEQLQDLSALGKACERKLRELSRTGQGLTDRQGTPAGKAVNLLPFVGELGKAWAERGTAIVHCHRKHEKGKKRSQKLKLFALPVVRKLPKLPTLALDATGTPRLLELATGRSVETVEGAFSGGLEGLHLADVPVSRRRWRRESGSKSGGRGGKAAWGADRRVVLRYAKRVGAKSVGLVTFKFAVDGWVQELSSAGLEVHTMHYGDEVGRNDFAAADVDMVVVAGTPFVPPAVVRLWASLEGAGLEELMHDEAVWERRRMPGGGVATVQVFPGEASQRAYTGIVRARLEQALGRALRWDWAPRCGALVLAEPWPTRHRLKLSTREREGLDGPAAEVAELLGVEPKEVPSAVRKLVDQVGGTFSAAAAVGCNERSVRRWKTGARTPSPEEVRNLFRKAGTFSESRTNRAPADHLAGPDTPNHLLTMGGWSALGRPEEMELIEQAARLAGGTQELAAAVGYSERAVRKWRSGTNNPGKRARAALEQFIATREPNPKTEASTEAATARVIIQECPEKVPAIGVLVSMLECDRSDAKHVVDSVPTVLLPMPHKRAVELVNKLAATGATAGLELAAGADLPSGRTYAPAVVDVGDMPPAPPPSPSPREEVRMGLDELRNWLTQPLQKPPRWLREAAAEAKGVGGFSRRIGRRRVNGEPTVDLDLAFERAQAQAERIDAPIYVRRLWGHVVHWLRKKGALPRGVNALTGKRGRRARSGAVRCKACGDTGRSSTGKACVPCERRREVARDPLVRAGQRIMR